ncbi:TPA: hypothetical protein H9326_002912 [Listeria monocytogenes]|nr:hypothetical protein [Listeria monocytogenes]
MKMLTYKDNTSQIKQLLSLLKPLTPTDDTFEFLANELLIQVYSAYENFLRELLIKLFSDAKTNYKYSPFLIEHKLWGVIENQEKKYIVPKGKIEDLQKNFPLLKESYFIENLSVIDTIVLERNAFAHTGTHKATLEQILSGYVAMQYIVKYLNFCYITSSRDDIEKLKLIQGFLKKLKTHSRKCIKDIKGTHIPQNMNAFDTYLSDIKCFKEKNVFSIQEKIGLFSIDSNLDFLNDCKGMLVSDFNSKLDKFEKDLFRAFFTVESIASLNISIVLNDIMRI